MSERVRVGLRHPLQDSNLDVEFESITVEVSVSQVNARCSMRTSSSSASIFSIDATPTIADLLCASFDKLVDEGPTKALKTGRETRRLFHQVTDACRRVPEDAVVGGRLLWSILGVECFGTLINPNTTSFRSVKAACALSGDPALWVCINDRGSVQGGILARALAMSCGSSSSSQSNNNNSNVAFVETSSKDVGGGGCSSNRKAGGGIVGSIIHRAFEAFRAEDPSASAEVQAVEAGIHPLTPTSHSGPASHSQRDIINAVVESAVRGGGGDEGGNTCATLGIANLSAYVGYNKGSGNKRERAEEEVEDVTEMVALRRFEESGSVGGLLRKFTKMPPTTPISYPSGQLSALMAKYAPSPRAVTLRTALVPFVVGSTAQYRPNAPQQENYNWSVYLRGVNNACLSSVIESVVFVLHPSFAHATQVIAKPPYVINEKGWGEFEVAIYVELKHVSAPVFVTRVTTPTVGKSSSSSSLRSPTTRVVEAPAAGSTSTFASATATTAAAAARSKVHVKTGHALQFSHRNCLLMRTLTQSDVEDKRLDVVRGAIGATTSEKLHSRMISLPSVSEVHSAFEAVETLRSNTTADAANKTTIATIPPPVLAQLRDPGFVHYRHCVPPFGLPLTGDVTGFTPFTHLEPPCVDEQRDELVIVNPNVALLAGCDAYLEEVNKREVLSRSSTSVDVSCLGDSSVSGALWGAILQHSPLLSLWRAGVVLPIAAKSVQQTAHLHAFLDQGKDGASIGEVGLIRLEQAHDTALVDGLREGVRQETHRLRQGLDAAY